MSNELDVYVSRFQNIPGVNIRAVVKDGQDSAAWYEVKMSDVVADLVVNELTIPSQLMTVSAEIQKWGRLSALTKRVWELEERKYRAWRSEFSLSVMNPSTKDKDWKKPTGDTIECMYRVQPEYHSKQAAVEQAEEVFNTAEAILQAFRAKKDVLITMRRRYHEDGAAAHS